MLRPGRAEPAAVAQLAGDVGANGVSRALHEASGGNPFLVVEAIEQLERDRGVAGVPDPAAVRRLASERIAASLLLRVGRVNAGALALGRAIAVLGEDATAVRAGRLSGVDGERVWGGAGCARARGDPRAGASRSRSRIPSSAPRSTRT